MEKIDRSHGSGGTSTSRLIEGIFQKHFSNPYLDGLTDAAVLPGAEKLAYTTDSYVVRPIFFPGGDIGRLAVCGTVNDLLTSGAKPAYITAAYILEEGLDLDDLERAAASMAAAAAEAGVKIVTGDTKVIESSDPGTPGLLINTSGVGFVPGGRDISPLNISDKDAVIVSGSLGDHHAAILSRRMNIQNDIRSDAAPLCEMVGKLMESGLHIHAMRDVTRGGLATVLCEMSHASGVSIYIEETALPVSQDVAAFSRMLGLDPLYMGNEGKMLFILPKEEADKALGLIRDSRYGENAAIIGETGEQGDAVVCLRTAIGGLRGLTPLSGEGLPRIC